jgi:hypothetical protein
VNEDAKDAEIGLIPSVESPSAHRYKGKAPPVRLWYSADHDVIESRMCASKEERIQNGWCIGCGAFRVDAYFCSECALGSDYVGAQFIVDHQSPTATAIGRGLQRRVDASAAYDQLISLQTVSEWYGAQEQDKRRPHGRISERARSKRIRDLVREANGDTYLHGAWTPPCPGFNRDWMRNGR